jgi:hypothetical protein
MTDGKDCPLSDCPCRKERDHFRTRVEELERDATKLLGMLDQIAVQFHDWPEGVVEPYDPFTLPDLIMRQGSEILAMVEKVLGKADQKLLKEIKRKYNA